MQIEIENIVPLLIGLSLALIGCDPNALPDLDANKEGTSQRRFLRAKKSRFRPIPAARRGSIEPRSHRVANPRFCLLPSTFRPLGRARWKIEP